MTAPNAELTELVERWSRGDESARETLFQLLSPLLRKLAHQQLQRHGRTLSLESTDLAQDAALKLIQRSSRPENQAHLIRLLAKMMRAACIDLARERKTQKRAGQKVSLSRIEADTGQSTDLLELDEAMSQLTVRDPLAGKITELRFFAGLSETEIATNLAVSRSTVSRKWQFSRLFLSRILTDD